MHYFVLWGTMGTNVPGVCLLEESLFTWIAKEQVLLVIKHKASNITLSYDFDNNLIATTLDTFGLTSLDFLNMPARSFALEIDKDVYSYLNIPAQLVYRDSTTQQFTFTGLSFTDRPLY